MTKTIAVLVGLLWMGLIVASNALTEHFGMVFGLATAGTFTAGLSFGVRDVLREVAGLRWAIVCIVCGAAIAAVLTSPALAIASAVAFLLAELVDTAVYEPLRRSGRLKAAAASQVPAGLLDSVVFLWIAPFAVWPAAGTQTLIKWAVVLIPLLILGVFRAVLRDRVRPACV